MNDWWKLALAGTAGAGLLAATGGLGAPLLSAAGGEGTAAAGTALGEGAAAAAPAAATGATTNAAVGIGAGAMPDVGAFVTSPIIPGGAAAPLSGELSGTSLDYGTAAGLADANAAAAAAPEPGLLAQAGHYAGMAGKAASAYSGVNNAMMAGQQPPRQAPQSRPVYQGDAPQISQATQGMLAAPQNQFAQMLLAQRQRGILG